MRSADFWTVLCKSRQKWHGPLRTVFLHVDIVDGLNTAELTRVKAWYCGSQQQSKQLCGNEANTVRKRVPNKYQVYQANNILRGSGASLPVTKLSSSTEGVPLASYSNLLFLTYTTPGEKGVGLRVASSGVTA